MKIGFDGKRAVSNNTGLGNYSRLVISELAAYAPDDELLVLTPKMKENDRLKPLHSHSNISFVTNESRLPGSLWRTFGITSQLRDAHIDIYHGLSNELPLNIASSGIPSVVTIHDVIYRRLPYCYAPIDRKIYDLKYGRSCRIADRIIAVSECTKKDIMHYYGIPAEKIDVVYQGCSPIFREHWSNDKKLELRRRLNLPEHYIVQVGTIERRKNLELTVRALSALPEEEHLVVIGRDNGYKKHVQEIAEQLGVTARILYIHSANFRDLPGICQMADVIAYPSRYEGFGIPVIEGIESGVPVVAATGSCLEEAGGPGAIYVNPDSPQEMARALNAILSGEADREEITARGLKHVRRFDTTLMADNIHNVYAKTIADCQQRRKRH